MRPLLLLALGLPTFLSAQITFQGTLIGKSGKPFAGAQVHRGIGKNLAVTDANGNFKIQIPWNEEYAFVGYTGDKKIFGYHLQPIMRDSLIVDTIHEGQGMEIIPVVEIGGGSTRYPIDEINPRDIWQNPSTGSGIESIIKSLGGVSSGNELSSTYNVRGGNYDENLIYVNDIEIYRPQLIHSGQQEGLSFINPDLVKTLRFSAGGFEAQYGDKMSSVLDVEYYRPDSFAARTNVGVLLNTLAIENSNKKWSWIFGVRYFSNSLLTKSLDIQGAYRMHFADAQTMISYRFNPRWQLEFLGNLALNRYSLIPQSRRTEFGTVQSAYQLEVFMGGAENMRYDYGMGALTLKFNIDKHRELKWIFSATGSNEQEYFDVEGAYFLSLLDNNLGSKDNLGKPLKTLGFGYFLDHGRNRLQTSIYNFSHIGTFGTSGDKNIFKYGVRVNYESILDKYKEWRYNDSDGYNIPPFGFATDSIILDDAVYAKNTLQSFRAQGFIQDRYRLNKAKNMWVGAGLRFHWWEINQQLFVTPRVNFSFEPNKQRNKNLPDSLKRNDMILRIAAGGYYQPGFYRELRDFSGKLNTKLKAQESWHVVAGMDRFFNMWDRRFKLTTEAYYKSMSNLDPYLYDNIRIRYYAQNSSRGYAYGVDNRINGEFVKGLESWFTMSVLQTREKITYTDENGNIVVSDWLRRPTDRRVNFAAIFQDELPTNPSFRANLNLIVGTGLPYFLNGKARYTTTPNVIPAYRRLDLGLSKVLFTDSMGIRLKRKYFKNVKEAWISLEVFNLLGINNVIAYSWVKDVNNNTYGVPEYLTGRRLNLRLHLSF
ncbi:MAG: TonB-dependent receptor [Bacteroidetes bacterium]|nr:TonB-dependent receptor [Bacteroidota bacterium]